MNYVRKLLLFLLACSPVIAAESPFIGTWKENFSKTYHSDLSKPPQSAVIHIESAGENRVKIVQEIVDSAGKKGQSVEESPLDGTETQPSGPSGPSANFIRSFRSISPNVWERIAKRPGDVRRGYWAVSSDGKMLVITGFGKDANGKEYYFHRVLERQ